MNRLTPLIIILVVGCLIISCNDDIAVGANILGTQPIEADFNDQIVITSKTVEPTSPFISYRNTGDFDRNPYLLGELDDPNFGVTSSTVFLTPMTTNSALPDFNISIIDSVVLAIPYDTIGLYGDANAIHNISVHRLQDAIDLASVDTLLASECLEYEDTPITELSIVPSPFDSVPVFDPISDSTITLVPQLRFTLDKDLWQEVLRDTLNTESTQQLVNQVKGYAIKSDPTASSMFGVNLLVTSPASIQIFYTDTISSFFTLDVNTTSNSSEARDETSIKHSCFESDYSGSEVERTLGDSLAELNYLEGLEGFNIEYDISNVLDIEDEFINYAVLELFVLEDDNQPIEQLLCMYESETQGFINISDFNSNLRSIYFDGALQEEELNGQTIRKYEVIITRHLIAFRNGDITSPFIYISPFNRGLANHSIIYGPNHPTFPAKLKIITTKP
jgi:hypothetical protein